MEGKEAVHDRDRQWGGGKKGRGKKERED